MKKTIKGLAPISAFYEPWREYEDPYAVYQPPLEQDLVSRTPFAEKTDDDIERERVAMLGRLLSPAQVDSATAVGDILPSFLMSNEEPYKARARYKSFRGKAPKMSAGRSLKLDMQEARAKLLKLLLGEPETEAFQAGQTPVRRRIRTFMGEY